MRWLYNHNPFYLLSACFLLHGASNTLRPAGPPIDPWPMMGLVGGYVVLMAVTGFLVVRFGRVWDDARSILVIVLLLLGEMAISLHEVWLDPRWWMGPLVGVVGLTFAVVVVEGLLRGLRMSLPVLFRGPMYLLFGLIYLYPAVPAAALRGREPELVPWLLYLFSPAAALGLLTLLPAVRRGPDYTRENGTPWVWPLYPWTIFVVLGVMLGLNAYALPQALDPVLTLSYEEAMLFSTTFAPYFLVPILFAVAVLVLEIGVVMSRADRPDPRASIVRRVGLVLPFAGVLLCLPMPSSFRQPNGLFLAEYTRAVGHPLFVTIVGVVLFHVVARLRGCTRSDWGLVAGLVLLASTTTAGAWTPTTPNPWLLVVATIVLVPGAATDSRRGLAGLLLLGLALRSGLGVDWPIPYVVAGCLQVVAMFGRDRFARVVHELLAFTWIAVAACGLVQPSAIGVRADLLHVLVVAAAVALSIARTTPMAMAAVVGTTAFGLGQAAVASWQLLVQNPRWYGLRSLLIATGSFLLAVVISVAKAGGWRWLRGRLRVTESTTELTE